MFLAEYVETHFASEEAVMERTGFPDLEAHRAAHEALRNEVRVMVARQGWTLTSELLNYLTTWLTTHLDTYDQALAAHLKP